MGDITLGTVSSGFNLSVVNDNFNDIENVINTEVLHSVGGNNVMSQPLDVNGHRTLNTPAPAYPTDLVRLSDIQALAISGETDASLINYTPNGVDAQIRNVQGKLREVISVTDYPTPQDALDYAATLDASEVVFPANTYDITMLFINGDNIRLSGHGAILHQSHDTVNSTTVGGAGQYKVSSAIFVERGCSNIEITGFTFTTNDASFPAFAAGYGSYFPSIAGQAFDGLKIYNNRFLGGQRRALFTQGGKHLQVYDNYVEDCGMTIHVGYGANELFYDNTTNITNKYSPYAPYIVNNTFNGYTSTDVTVCLFLTGAIKFTVRDNKLINMNEATALRPLMIYSNDYGPYDEDGTARAYIEGEVVNNIIHGTFKDGLEVRGLSPNGLATWTNSYEMRVNVSGNKIVGTGHGLKFEEVYNTRASNNYVSVSGSPLYLDQHIVHVGIYNNYLQSLTNGYDDTTIYAGWASGSGGFVFEGNRVYTPTGSLYALRSQTTATWVDLNNNYWFFDADQSGARTIVLTNASKLRISKNTFNIETDQLIYALVLTGSGSRASCDIKDNDVVSINGTGAATFRFADITSFEDVNVSDNITGGAISITGSDRVRVSSNTMIMPSSNSVRAVYVDNSAYNAQTFAWIDKNYIYNSGALNSPGIGVASYNNASNNTLSKVSMNYVSGNSSGALIQQTTHGTIEHIGNTIVNAGGGGTSTAVTGSATSTAL